MKHFFMILVLFVAMLSIGCVTIRVEKPDGTKYSYSRWLGDQNLEGVEMTTSDGGSFSIGKQHGSNSLDNTIENISATLKNMSEVVTKVPIP